MVVVVAAAVEAAVEVVVVGVRTLAGMWQRWSLMVWALLRWSVVERR